MALFARGDAHAAMCERKAGRGLRATFFYMSVRALARVNKLVDEVGEPIEFVQKGIEATCRILVASDIEKRHSPV
jgi:hypothetical protein